VGTFVRDLVTGDAQDPARTPARFRFQSFQR